jgi:hypothetical protein
VTIASDGDIHLAIMLDPATASFGLQNHHVFISAKQARKLGV